MSCTMACASPTAAIVAAATLSNRYITDRFLPDKAIDLMDEAAARLRMQVNSKPEELDEIDRRIMQLQIEREALKKETDPASKDRLQKLEKELAEAGREIRRHDAQLAGRERESSPLPPSSRRSLRTARHATWIGPAQGRFRQGGRAGLCHDSGTREEAEGG